MYLVSCPVQHVVMLYDLGTSMLLTAICHAVYINICYVLNPVVPVMHSMYGMPLLGMMVSTKYQCIDNGAEAVLATAAKTIAQGRNYMLCA